MITFIYLWCAAIVYGLTAGQPICDRKDGQCSFGDVCLNKDDKGSCKSFDIEMKGGDCIKFNDSKEYADHYLRIKLMNGFIKGSKLSVDSTMYLDERRNTTAHLYSVDSREIFNISFGVQWDPKREGGFYERFPNNSKVMIPVGWAGAPVQLINILDKKPLRQFLRNNGKFINIGFDKNVALKFASPDCEELKNPVVLHLTSQIFPTKICYTVRPTAACPTKKVDVGKKVKTEAENIATNCTIFDRSTSKLSSPPYLPLRQGFKSGKMISVRASLWPEADYFDIYISDRHRSMAFHLTVKPRIDRIDLRYVVDEKLHYETEFAKKLFNLNGTFKLDLYLEKNDLLIFVNDSLAARFSLERSLKLRMAYFFVIGDLIVDTVCYEDGKPPVTAEFRAEAENIATKCTIFDRSTSEWETPPYLPLRQGFKSGKMISVRALLGPEADHFIVEIMGRHHSRDFQLSVQPRRNLIDLNYVLDGKWHYETASANKLFNIKETFKLDLYLEKNDLLVFVNDFLTARFSLEGSIKLPRAYLHVFGDVIVDTVCYKDGKAPLTEAEYIATNCTIFDRSTSGWDTLPDLRLRQGFESGKMISVRASLRPEADHFNLDISYIYSPTDDQLSDHSTDHFLSLKLRRDRIDLGYKLDGKLHYGTEFVNTLFNVNGKFKLDLYLEKNDLLIFVNDSLAARFSLKGSFKQPRAYLFVSGDIIVDTVCYEDGKAPVTALDHENESK